jgi:hypothetical protein
MAGERLERSFFLFLMDHAMLIRQRLGLETEVKTCQACGCGKCSGYKPTDGEGGDCAVCACPVVEHDPASLGEDEFEHEDEDYVSEFGGGEDW